MVAEEYADVCQVLEELGLGAEMQAERVVHILNKSDQIDDMADATADETREYLENLLGSGVFVSAITGAGIDDALLVLDEKINADDIRLVVALAPEDGAPRAWLHAHGTVHSSVFDEIGNETVSLTLSVANRNRFVARWPEL
jgi:50S ribosomal subunit-associated GTPase HflX